MRRNLLAAIFLYCEGIFNYYTLTFYLKYFPGNLFTNSLFFACSDLLAFVFAGMLLYFTSVRFAIRVGSAFAAIGGFLYLFLSPHAALIPFIVCFSRVGQSTIFNITLISVSRLFPTLFTANAYGIVNFCGHSVACLAPFVAELNDPAPFIVFLSLIAVAVLSSFFIEEVKSTRFSSKE